MGRPGPRVKFAIVIPAYNEERTVAAAVASARPYGTVIVVDDGSRDNTVAEATRAGAQVVSLKPNRGYDQAIQAGFERAAQLGVDTVVTFDADGEHRTESLALACSALEDGQIDLVIGVRSQIPRFSESLFNAYCRFRYGVPDIVCGLKGYRLKLFTEHGCFDNYNSIGTQLALWAMSQGKRVKLVPVQTTRRADTPRLGAFLKGNYLILRAFWLGFLRNSWFARLRRGELSKGTSRT